MLQINDNLVITTRAPAVPTNFEDHPPCNIITNWEHFYSVLGNTWKAPHDNMNTIKKHKKTRAAKTYLMEMLATSLRTYWTTFHMPIHSHPIKLVT